MLLSLAHSGSEGVRERGRVLALTRGSGPTSAEHSGRSIDEVREKTERDFFLTPEEALEFGVIDEIFKPHKA